MYSLNKVYLIGKVSNIKENVYNGHLNIRFTVITERSYKKSTGETVKMTDFHNISVWDSKAEVCKKYLKNADYVSIVGELTYNKDKTDPKKIWTEVRIPDDEEIGFLGSKKFVEDEMDQEKIPVNNPIKKYIKKKEEKSKKTLGTIPLKYYEDDIPF